MTACTQPGCIGAIVDDYCDVCGSPAGAIPFVPAEAAASAGSPSPSDEPGAVGRGSEVSPEPKSEALDTACAQPGCTGTIVDGYCDACGSPAGAVPFVPAEAAASTRSPAPAEELGITASPALTPAPAPVDEEIPTRPTPQVKMTRLQLTTQEQEMADPGAADPGDVDARKVDAEKVDPAAGDIEKVDVEKELLEDIQGSREVEATLRRLIAPAAADIERGDTAEAEPAAADLEEGDTVEVEPAVADLEEGDTAEVEAAVADVGEADTVEVEPAVADVEVADTVEVEPAVADLEEGDTAEVEAAAAADVGEADTVEVEPAVADVEVADTAEIEAAAAADVGEADTATAGPHDDDTVETPAVIAVHSGGRHPHPQLPEQQALGPVQVHNPAEKRRIGSLALAATALAALLIGALLFAASRDGGVTAQSVPTVTATATATVTEPTREPSDESTHAGEEESTIQLEDLVDSARPFETVRIQGTYHDGANTFLRVQRWEAGKWLAFPLPTKSDPSGRFTAYVEFGQPGRYRLRVLHPGSGTTSKSFVLVIKGG